MRFYEFLERLINNATIDQSSALVGMLLNKDIAGVLFRDKTRCFALTMSHDKGGFYILKKFNVDPDMSLKLDASCVMPEEHRQRFKELLHARMELFNRRTDIKSEGPCGRLGWDGTWVHVLPPADTESFGMSLIDGAAKDNNDDDELY